VGGGEGIKDKEMSKMEGRVNRARGLLSLVFVCQQTWEASPWRQRCLFLEDIRKLVPSALIENGR